MCTVLLTPKGPLSFSHHWCCMLMQIIVYELETYDVVITPVHDKGALRLLMQGNVMLSLAAVTVLIKSVKVTGWARIY